MQPSRNDAHARATDLEGDLRIARERIVLLEREKAELLARVAQLKAELESALLGKTKLRSGLRYLTPKDTDGNVSE